METYKGKINEFVNWSSGVNLLTGNTVQGVDENHRISGESIRTLLQEHLLTPFVTFEDDKSGKILFFSSTDALGQWKILTNYNGDTENQEDVNKAAGLVIYSMDLPATYTITGLSEFDRKRYIIEGNSTSENAILNMTLGLEDALGQSTFDTITTTITITDSTGEIRYSLPEHIETGEPWSKNIYRYLLSGENIINISFKANNHAASTTKTFRIYLVTFSISSTFAGYYSPVANGVPFIFTLQAKRSVNLPIKAYIYIDGDLARIADQNNSRAEWEDSSLNSEPQRRFNIKNTYAASTSEQKVKHVMVIRAEMSDPESQSHFNSNVLVYEFEVAPQNDDLSYTYVNIAASIASGNYTETEVVDSDGVSRVFPMLNTTQYAITNIDWGYNTDSYSLYLQKNVTWAIRTGSNGDYTYRNVADILGIKDTKPESLQLVSGEYYSFETDNSCLVARIEENGNLVDSSVYPLTVAESTMLITETGNYSLKLSALGKTNGSDTKNLWTDEENDIHTTFSPGVTFDKQNGWDNNSLVLKGQSSFAIINYCLFPSSYAGTPYQVGTSGATVEIDFKPEYVANEDDILVTIGNIENAHIRITTNSAAFYANNQPVVKTNFKSGERIKLAFIFNDDNSGTKDANLVYIVNNGILERTWNRGLGRLTDDSGNIKIGGSNSSVRIYSIRAYRFALSPKQALANYMFDNSSDVALLSRNDIYGNGAYVTYNGVYGKLDIIRIEGDLTNILRNKSQKEYATVNIIRESNTDPSRNFTVENCRIRNHGQSTLSYPITSMKFWLNKSGLFNDAGTIEYTPLFNCDAQQYLGLGKNRYIMKTGAIPSNKFVLQANYADSSGTHNGSLLRLIQDTWYNAEFKNGNATEFKLRTAPQLFASGTKVTHNNLSLNETGWVEGTYNIDQDAVTSAGNRIYNSQYAGLTWPEITHVDFPYRLRVAADSFPCVVFYRDTSSSNAELTLLGQYVFMDDKKSDYVYGERSIYYTSDTSDPFCLKAANSKLDKATNKIWDNDKVLQIEVVYPNSPLTSYVNDVVAESYELDENDNLIAAPNSPQYRFDHVVSTDSSGKTTKFQWEEHFDLIYPDKDDIIENPDEFVAKVLPFHEFLTWITGIGKMRLQGERVGENGAKSRVTVPELDEFKRTAHDHLDLYKLAAYYVFFLRFGLVDSVERNAQLKTYDGQHWHYEPWDMDIALGCANTGVIAYDPPLTRDTTRPGGYVFAGRTDSQSNVLWDCLEAWDEWLDVVKEVAKALYEAGLTYKNAIKMFDNEYADKWSETLYNESGHYKYIDAVEQEKYHLYLNGARTSHRHWWLSKSMNYYDAKWECGDFTRYSIESRFLKSSTSAGSLVMKIYPTTNTFFKVVQGSSDSVTDLGGGLREAFVTPGGEASIDISGKNFTDKDTLFIYGATSISKLDMSRILNGNGTAYSDITLGKAYDPVLGALLKELILGAECTPNIYTNPNASSYESDRTLGANAITAIATLDDGSAGDALESLEVLDVIGWHSTGNSVGDWLSGLMSESGHDRKNIKKLYAMGCDMATQFSTGTSGNAFEDVRLPDTIRELVLTNSSWQSMTFWHTTVDQVTGRATYTKLSSIPASVNIVHLAGSTGKNECSLQLVKDWITAIDNSLPSGHTEEDLYTALSNKTLLVDQARWGTGSVTLTYNDIVRLAHFGNGGEVFPIKGYALIQPDLTGLTSARLAYLQSVFGENVFNIGTTNSNLVIDYVNDEIVISISSIRGEEPLIIENDNIYIKEPSTAKLSANRFTLVSGNMNNQLAMTGGVNDPTVTENLTENKYIWGFVDSIDAPVGSTMSYHSTYADLERGLDGAIRLRTQEGDGHDYVLYIRVVYGKQEGGNIRLIADTIAINVIGVTYPSDYIWAVTSNGNLILQFKYTQPIITSLFGTAAYTALGDNAPVYVFNNINQTFEFSLKPSEPKYYIDSNTGNQAENWTANELNESVSYFIELFENAAYQSTEYLTRESLAENINTSISLGSGTYVDVLHNASNGGIPVKSVITLPNDPVLFKITGKAKIGGKEEVRKYVYFIVINDPTPIIPGSTALLSTTMWNKYCNDYGMTYISAQSMYRFHLLGISGMIDFSQSSSISSLQTNTGQSVLNYVPYVTGLNFEDCTSLDTSTLDLTNCPNLESLNTEGTTLGVILPNRSKITTMQLGSPVQIQLNQPLTLGEPGTIYTVESSSNLADLRLENININNVRGFALFDSLYKTS